MTFDEKTAKEILRLLGTYGGTHQLIEMCEDIISKFEVCAISTGRNASKPEGTRIIMKEYPTELQAQQRVRELRDKLLTSVDGAEGKEAWVYFYREKD